MGAQTRKERFCLRFQNVQGVTLSQILRQSFPIPLLQKLFQVLRSRRSRTLSAVMWLDDGMIKLYSCLGIGMVLVFCRAPMPEVVSSSISKVGPGEFSCQQFLSY